MISCLYFAQTNRQGDEEVYRRAVEEVDKILAGGKLTEKDLQNLQRNFANNVMMQQETMPAQEAQHFTQSHAPAAETVA